MVSERNLKLLAVSTPYIVKTQMFVKSLMSQQFHGSNTQNVDKNNRPT